MEQIDELTGLDCWKLRIENVGFKMTKVSILGQRDGLKGTVIIPAKDLLKAVLAEAKEEV